MWIINLIGILNIVHLPGIFRFTKDDDFRQLMTSITDPTWLGGTRIFATASTQKPSDTPEILTSIMQSIIATDSHVAYVDIREPGVELLRRYIGGYVECVLASDVVDHSKPDVIAFMRLAERFMEQTQNQHSHERPN